MELALSRACTDGAPGNKVSDELRGNGIEKLGTNGNTKRSEVAQKLASCTKPLVNLERAIDVRVIDESFPSNSSARFLARKLLS